MPNLSKLIGWQYITTDPGMSFVYQWYIVIFLAIVLLTSVFLLIVRLLKKNYLSELSIRTNKLLVNWLLYPSIIGLLLVFFRNQTLPTLSWRLWLEALAIIWLSGSIYILYFLIFIFPAENKKIKLLSTKQKYIP